MIKKRNFVVDLFSRFLFSFFFMFDLLLLLSRVRQKEKKREKEKLDILIELQEEIFSFILNLIIIDNINLIE